MNLRNLLSVGVAAGILAAMSMVPASAQVLAPIVGETNSDGPANPNVIYTSGGAGAGGLTLSTNTGIIAGKVGQGTVTPASVTFSLLTNASGYTFSSTTGAFDQPLNGGSFMVIGLPGSSQAGVTLLSGTFGQSDLQGNNGGSSGGLTLTMNTLTYGAGTFFPAGFQNSNGTLSVNFNSITPFVANAGGLSSFNASDGITWSAVRTPAVPEPGALALLSSMGVCGSVFAFRRLRRSK